MEFIGTCSEILLPLFKPHDIEAVIEDDVVRVPSKPDVRMLLRVYKTGQRIVSLEAICDLGDEKVMHEHSAGVGEMQEEAVIDAQANFVGSVFHVWLSALFRKKNEYAEQQFWQFGPDDRKVTIGSANGRGASDAIDHVGWLKAWQQALRQVPLSPGPHWASLIYARHAGQTVACETLFDNEVNEELQKKMLEFAWPENEEFYLVRQFIFIE